MVLYKLDEATKIPLYRIEHEVTRTPAVPGVRSQATDSLRRAWSKALQKAEEAKSDLTYLLDRIDNRIAIPIPAWADPSRPKKQPAPKPRSPGVYVPDPIRGMRVPGDTADEILLGDAYGSTRHHYGPDSRFDGSRRHGVLGPRGKPVHAGHMHSPRRSPPLPGRARLTVPARQKRSGRARYQFP